MVSCYIKYHPLSTTHFRIIKIEFLDVEKVPFPNNELINAFITYLDPHKV